MDQDEEKTDRGSVANAFYIMYCIPLELPFITFSSDKIVANRFTKNVSRSWTDSTKISTASKEYPHFEHWAYYDLISYPWAGAGKDVEYPMSLRAIHAAVTRDIDLSQTLVGRAGIMPKNHVWTPEEREACEQMRIKIETGAYLNDQPKKFFGNDLKTILNSFKRLRNNKLRWDPTISKDWLSTWDTPTFPEEVVELRHQHDTDPHPNMYIDPKSMKYAHPTIGRYDVRLARGGVYWLYFVEHGEVIRAPSGYKNNTSASSRARKIWRDYWTGELKNGVISQIEYDERMTALGSSRPVDYSVFQQTLTIPTLEKKTPAPSATIAETIELDDEPQSSVPEQGEMVLVTPIEPPPMHVEEEEEPETIHVKTDNEPEQPIISNTETFESSTAVSVLNVMGTAAGLKFNSEHDQKMMFSLAALLIMQFKTEHDREQALLMANKLLTSDLGAHAHRASLVKVMKNVIMPENNFLDADIESAPAHLVD